MTIKQLLSARRPLAIALAAGAVVVALVLWRGSGQPPADSAANGAAQRPALTVTVTVPVREEWPQMLVANGNVVAWQEAVIGPEITGYRITEVLVDVGERVK